MFFTCRSDLILLVDHGRCPHVVSEGHVYLDQTFKARLWNATASAGARVLVMGARTAFVSASKEEPGFVSAATYIHKTCCGCQLCVTKTD